MYKPTLRPCFIALLLATVANGAAAQYIWVDEKGMKQLSDRPPPASVPIQNILKLPGKPTALPAPEAGAGAAAGAAKAPDEKAPPTLADQEADYRKRAAEKAEKDKKAAEDARIKAAQRENCAAARRYLAQLNSGERISSPTANGERAYMSDAERADSTARTRDLVAKCQ